MIDKVYAAIPADVRENKIINKDTWVYHPEKGSLLVFRKDADRMTSDEDDTWYESPADFPVDDVAVDGAVVFDEVDNSGIDIPAVHAVFSLDREAILSLLLDSDAELPDGIDEIEDLLELQRIAAEILA